MSSLFLSLFLVHSILSMQTSFPIWKTSIYFRAGQQSVINTLTGNTQTPQYTFIFSSALSGVPNIAYGIAKYQGLDTLLDERFQIFRIGLSETSFSVAIQITGFTSLYLLRVAYLAIEPTFPHHLNSFDNIPVNYSSGALVWYLLKQTNFSTRSVSQRTYLNTINYTEQCVGRKYDNFTIPVDRYKIVMLMTSLFVSTRKETSAGQNFSMDLRIESTILTQQTYSIYIRLKVNVIVDRLHFSQIVFDPIDIESSFKYKLIYEQWTLNNFGGLKMIPKEFQDNFIMGITEFTSELGYCGFDYMWDWLSTESFFGVQIFQSITRADLCAFVRITSSIVYIQAWQCLAPHYYYNRTTGICQDQCGLYFYPTQKIVDIEIQYNCQPCDWACSQCNSSQKCLSCNSDDMRLFNGSCYCPNGYVDTLTVTKCQSCLDPNCVICEKNPNYKSNPLPDDPITTGMSNLCVLCDQGYILNDTTKSCNPWARCNSSKNELLNYDTNVCEVCLISGCSQCRQSMQIKFNGTIANVMQFGAPNRMLTVSSPFGVVSCGLCDEQNQFFKNLTTKICEKCLLKQCLVCSSLYTCVQCNSLNQYFINEKTKLCDKCTLQGCINCLNLTACRSCDSINGYFLTSQSKLCKFCGLGCSDCQIQQNEVKSSSCNGCLSGLVYLDGKCSCNKGYFINVLNSTSFECSPCNPLCKHCENSSFTCTSCYFQQNRVLSTKGNNCQCSPSNYVESVSNIICSKKDNSLPDLGYSINSVTSQVEQICGDGARLTLDCDDGNLVNRDGCSSECKIQENFFCTDEVYEMSLCQYIGNISITKYNITKDPFANLLDIQLQMNPQLVMYNSLNWQKGLYFGGSSQIHVIESYMKTVNILFVKARYNQNIKNSNITLGYDLSTNTNLSHHIKSQYALEYLNQPSKLTQSANNRNFNFIQTKIDFSKTMNNLEVAYYPEKTYSTIKFFQLIFTIIMVIYVALVFGAVILFKRIVPTMVVFTSIQLCFVSLSSIQNFQPQTFSIINNFDQVFGLNNMENYLTECFHEDINPISFKNLQFMGCYTSNINLMVVFEIAAIFGTITMFIIQLFWLQKFGKKYGGYFKRCLSNLVFFNLSNVVITLGIIQFKNMNLIDIGLICLQVLLTILHLILILKFKKTYFIQVDIADYEENLIQNQNDAIDDWNDDANSSQNNKKSTKSQTIDYKPAPDPLMQILSKKESNEQVFSGQISGQQKQQLKHNNAKQGSQTPQNINKQIVYFIIFILTTGIFCPTIYFLSSEQYPLFCNFASIVSVIILIIVQISLKPFAVEYKSQKRIEQRKQFRRSNQIYFSLLSANFYISYGWILCFLFINVLFSALEQSYHHDVDKMVNIMSILSYGQVITFLLMMSYLLFAWGYSAYLSFFDDDILLRYNKAKQQKRQKESLSSIGNGDQISQTYRSEQNVVKQSKEQQNKVKAIESEASSQIQSSESSSIAEVLNKYRKRQLSGCTRQTKNLETTISRPYETIDYDNQFMQITKPNRRIIIPTLQNQQNLIFEMEQDSLERERF